MKIDFRSRLRHSLFLKILLLFVAAAMSIAAAYVAYEVYSDLDTDGAIQRLGVNYGNYVVDEIGVPVDTHQAAQIAKSHRLMIRVESPDFSWVSEPRTPSFDELSLPADGGETADRAVAYRGSGLAADVRRGDTRYLVLIVFDELVFGTPFQISAIMFIVFTLMVVALLHHALRRLLSPIEDLHDSVQRVSEGNLEIALHTDRKDELGSLIRSFGEMARNVKHRIQARDQLLSDVSHELLSPLTRMKVALEFIPDGPAKQDILDDVNECQAMVTEILETERLASRHGGLRRQHVDLADLIRASAESFAAQKPGVVVVEPLDPIWLDLDPDRIRTMLGNLIANAIKYSTDDAGPVRLSAEQTRDEVVVIIEDNGCGIPEQDLARVFEPFFRVDRARTPTPGGYGLGLSLAKKIMEAHGGLIELESTVGVGTRISLRFGRS